MASTYRNRFFYATALGKLPSILIMLVLVNRILR